MFIPKDMIIQITELSEYFNNQFLREVYKFNIN